MALRVVWSRTTGSLHPEVGSNSYSIVCHGISRPRNRVAPINLAGVARYNTAAPRNPRPPPSHRGTERTPHQKGDPEKTAKANSAPRRQTSRPNAKRDDPKLPDFKSIDFASLPKLKEGSLIRWSKPDYSSDTLRAFHASPYTVYRCPYFALRTCSINSMPSKPVHPFPPLPTNAHSSREDEYTTIPFGLLVQKSQISNSAVERNRVRTRMKAAVDIVSRTALNVETDGMGVGMGERNSEWFVTGNAYLATMAATTYDAPMAELCEHVARAFLFLKNQNSIAKNQRPRRYSPKYPR